MAAHATPRPGVGNRVRGWIEEGTARLMSPSRSAVLVAIGSAAVLADGLQAAFGWARDARERPLELFNGSLGRAMSRLWPGARDAPSSDLQNRNALEK